MKKWVVLMVLWGLAGHAAAALVAHYDMKTDFGADDPVLDVSGNGWHGSAVGNVSGSEGVAHFPGEAGGGGYIKLPDPNVALGLEGTVSAKVVFDGDDTTNPIDTVWYDADAYQDNKKALFLQGNDLIAEVNAAPGKPGGTFEVSTDISAHFGTSLDILFTWKDGVSCYLLVNGTAVGVQLIPAGTLAPLSERTVDAVVLGQNPAVAAKHRMKGTLHDVKILDTYNGSPPPPPDCATVVDWGYGLDYDFQPDCYVNDIDLSEFAAEWLFCVDPDDPTCDHPWETDPNSPF